MTMSLTAGSPRHPGDTQIVLPQGDPSILYQRDRNARLLPCLSLLMVTYNRRLDVTRCLASLFDAWPRCLLEFLALDNGSTDGTWELLASHNEIRLTRWPQNRGLAPALKELAGQARGEWLLFLDSDTVVPAGGIDALLDFACTGDEIGAVAPRMRDLSGDIQMTARDFPGPLNALFGRQTFLSRLWPNNPVTKKFLKAEAQSANQPFRCDWVAFAAALVRRNALEAVGSIDPSFFVYWVDTDFFRRLAHRGWQVWCFPAIEVIHLEHNRTRQFRSPRAIMDFHQGAFQYFYRHHGWRGVNPLLWLAGVGLFLRAILHLAINQWRPRAGEKG